jgi:SAM-dependent methyltransferase
MLQEGWLVPNARIAVVGAGTGHEAFAAAAAGFQVTAFDFAPEAVRAMEQRLQASAVSLTAVSLTAVSLTPVLADILNLHRTHPQAFDAVLEHTCYCAIDPQHRDAYVEAVAGCLVPGGVLFGLFYNHGRPGGPPFDTTEADVRRRFERFRFERFVRATDSFPHRTNQEWEALFRL